MDVALVSVKDDDVWLKENATLNNKDRLDILKSLDRNVYRQVSNYKVDLSELYSPPRLTAKAEQYGLRPGMAIDLTSGFDLGKEEDQIKVWDHLKKDQPEMIFMCPDCFPWSQLKALSKHKQSPEKREAELAGAREHLAFCVLIARYQIAHGRWFAFEHPWGAASWREPDMQKLAGQDGVHRVRTDMCAHGMAVEDSLGDGGRSSDLLNLKATGILTNCQELRGHVDGALWWTSRTRNAVGQSRPSSCTRVSSEVRQLGA